MSTAKIEQRIEALENRGKSGFPRFLVRFEEPDGTIRYPGEGSSFSPCTPEEWAEAEKPENEDLFHLMAIQYVCVPHSRPEMVSNPAAKCDECDMRERCKVRVREGTANNVHYGGDVQWRDTSPTGPALP
jgi:hypothetical protein